MQHLSRFAFACASVMLMLLALLLLTFGMIDLLSALGHSWHAGRNAILQAISYVVIAVAVFDVAKYFVEEEVIQTSGKKSLGEARASLTKFITTIIIAVFIEGLVGVFETNTSEPSDILYPASLLVVATLIVVSLGVFQRMSVDAEREKKKVGGDE
ncbi:hypothetical protein KOEU_11670 [Komagataeibacter europaeus]|uniref:GNAT family acetyltransferase n=2 Tax=Komagataeibacter europaeus TaxID=33995 RepID=A0A0D6Q3P5_KOMEU|nr:hypothetical protein [Komagataeibacter europaeus]ARW15587.1 hypothetical protein S101446_00446 [Komagataeibacter europaeus]KON65327.1 hypothetical protein KOEU_11670 [Komagataeibacter europaeus]GAN98059.1 hypothetical protein Geu3261_0407_002 [Komagataeibacter europaeus NBRC 3261]GBQ47109.1 hypothetical protein AA18890_2716 [Komagataeibacter europaeus LMG 18890]